MHTVLVSGKTADFACVGLFSASQINARLLDRVYIYFKNRNGGIGEPEFRLRELSWML